MSTAYHEILVSDIVPTPDNKRKIDEKAESFIDLKNSIAAGGVRVPVHVRVCPNRAGKYDLRAGERRYRACLALGIETIPAIVQAGMDDEAALDLTYIENNFRESLKPLEEAAEIALLMERFGGNAGSIAKRIGKSEKWVRVRANIAKGLAKSWKNIFAKPDKYPGFQSWTLTHLGLIARLPKAIQLKLLEDFTDSGVKWDLDDETLLPEAGACSKCCKRTGHQPMLWFEAHDQGGQNDRCTDYACYERKRAAWLARRACELREKHPNLIFVADDYPHYNEAEMIAQSCGPYVHKFQYKTTGKSSKGAVPAMYVNGKSAGHLVYVRLDSGGRFRGTRVEGKPTPLVERRAMLDAKRWAQVLLQLREKITVTEVDAVTYAAPATGIMALTAFLGNVGRYYGQSTVTVPQKAVRELLADHETGQERALQYLWESLKPTLKQLLTYPGPVNRTPAYLIEKAKWIAEVIGVDIEALFADVCKRKGFTEPKSWKNLKADGTPKAKKAKKAGKKVAAADDRR